jgi:hypothetical protein
MSVFFVDCRAKLLNERERKKSQSEKGEVKDEGWGDCGVCDV